MNIFYLDEDPRLAATYLCDKHVVKMVLESSQMLSTAYRLCGGKHVDEVYRAAYPNHPCTKWVRTSQQNYEWLLKHTEWLFAEYTSRYHKQHKSFRLLDYLSRISSLSFPSIGLTAPAQAMPDEFKDANPVQAYRNYYALCKYKTIRMVWTNSSKPLWLGADYALSM